MKKIIEKLTDEQQSIEAPWWVYAFVVPVAMVIIMAVAGWLETSCA